MFLFRAVLVERPDVVVGTPSRVLVHLKEKVRGHRKSEFEYQNVLKMLKNFPPTPPYWLRLMFTWLVDDLNFIFHSSPY